MLFYGWVHIFLLFKFFSFIDRLKDVFDHQKLIITEGKENSFRKYMVLNIHGKLSAIQFPSNSVNLYQYAAE